MKYFPGLGKVRGFCGGPGKFRKDLEKSGTLKINSYGRQSSENLFKRVKDVGYFLIGKSKPISLLIGATLIEKNLLPWGANSLLKE